VRGLYPRSHLTLTFDPKRWSDKGISQRQAQWWWRRLVRVLNAEQGGDRFRRKWGHSYFSYVLGIEHHRSGAIHAHALVDQWVDFELVHRWWNYYCGYAWIRKVQEAQGTAALRYVLKYVVKEADVCIWLQRRRAELFTPVRRRAARPGVPSAA